MNSQAQPTCHPVTSHTYKGYQHTTLWGTGFWYPTRAQYLSDVPF